MGNSSCNLFKISQVHILIQQRRRMNLTKKIIATWLHSLHRANNRLLLPGILDPQDRFHRALHQFPRCIEATVVGGALVNQG